MKYGVGNETLVTVFADSFVAFSIEPDFSSVDHGDFSILVSFPNSLNDSITETNSEGSIE